MHMKYAGAHVSIAGGVSQAPLNATQIGAQGFGMFTKNQRQWNATPYSEAEITAFKQHLATHHYPAKSILPHAGYLINLASPDEAAWAHSIDAFTDELQRCHQLGLDRLNLHPGSHLGKLKPKEAIQRVADAVNESLRRTEGVTVVLENTAGAGFTMGATFEDLAAMIKGIKDKKRAGVCLDTCHLFAAGFDLRLAKDYEAIFKAFEKVVGLDCLKGLHLNDSKGDLGSHRDRHESLGKGFLGWPLFERIMRDTRFDDIPLILETPDETLWPSEIKSLQEFAR
jgi:deoxyribonuclease-4